MLHEVSENKTMLADPLTFEPEVGFDFLTQR